MYKQCMSNNSPCKHNHLVTNAALPEHPVATALAPLCTQQWLLLTFVAALLLLHRNALHLPVVPTVAMSDIRIKAATSS